jgi:hypothetical protein
VLVLDRLRALLASGAEVSEALAPLALDASTQRAVLDQSAKLAERWTTRAGELKATCDKRNPHRLIALALAAMFALAGSAATAESSLKDENAKELERLLAVPAENVPVPFSFRKPPRTPGRHS